MARKQRKPFLAEVAYKRSKSVTTSTNAIRFMVEYGSACDDLEEEISLPQLAAHIGVATSLVYRRRDAFRKCFPNDDPLKMWEIVRPLLKKSAFAHEPTIAQVMYVSAFEVGLIEKYPA